MGCDGVLRVAPPCSGPSGIAEFCFYCFNDETVCRPGWPVRGETKGGVGHFRLAHTLLSLLLSQSLKVHFFDNLFPPWFHDWPDSGAKSLSVNGFLNHRLEVPRILNHRMAVPSIALRSVCFIVIFCVVQNSHRFPFSILRFHFLHKARTMCVENNLIAVAHITFFVTIEKLKNSAFCNNFLTECL